MEWLQNLLNIKPQATDQERLFNAPTPVVKRPEPGPQPNIPYKQYPFGENNISVWSVDKPYFQGNKSVVPRSLNALIPERLNKPYNLYFNTEGRPFLENDNEEGAPLKQIPLDNYQQQPDVPYRTLNPRQYGQAMPYRRQKVQEEWRSWET